MARKKTRDTCCKPETSPGCRTSQSVQNLQPFPEVGQLADNSNLPLPLLARRIKGVQGRACSYVVRSVKLDRSTLCFEQHGSAPNFQGGVLTLCTCKQQMRSSQSADERSNVWIAGFTSRTIHEGRHWLCGKVVAKGTRSSRLAQSVLTLWQGTTCGAAMIADLPRRR